MSVVQIIAQLGCMVVIPAGALGYHKTATVALIIQIICAAIFIFNVINN